MIGRLYDWWRDLCFAVGVLVDSAMDVWGGDDDA